MTASQGPPPRRSPNRLSPTRFVLAFGVVSMLADFVYEGARSVTGPYLATLGASATLVGFVTGLGEAVGLVLRLATGRLSDRTGRHWTLSIAGYVITLVSVPLLAVAHALWSACTLVVSERLGKAVRTPARDTMLAEAGSAGGRGRAFAMHEALDQSGALAGPLLVALVIALSGYRLAFAVLAVPGVLAVLTLAWLRRAVPVPAAYEHGHAEGRQEPDPADGAGLSARFWLYAAFTAASMTGFATFGVLSFHLQTRHVVSNAVIPVVYAAAMGAAALSALGSGWLYDRFGLRGLVVALPLAAAVPFLSFSTTPALVWAGAIVWGAATGVHESTMRAAVADLIPAAKRGTGYGIFAACYGLAWLAGSTLLGALYSHSVGAATAAAVIAQVLAAVLFIPLALVPGRAAAR